MAVGSTNGKQAVFETIPSVKKAILGRNGGVGTLNPVQRAFLPEHIHPPFIIFGKITEEWMGYCDNRACPFHDRYDIINIGLEWR